jgi:hypothetical protein
MHIGLDPEVLRFDFNVNGPADPRTVERVGMGVNLEPGDLPAYGQVLAGVLAGDSTLSVRGDQAVETWRNRGTSVAGLARRCRAAGGVRGRQRRPDNPAEDRITSAPRGLW